MHNILLFSFNSFLFVLDFLIIACVSSSFNGDGRGILIFPHVAGDLGPSVGGDQLALGVAGYNDARFTKLAVVEGAVGDRYHRVAGQDQPWYDEVFIRIVLSHTQAIWSHPASVVFPVVHLGE